MQPIKTYSDEDIGKIVNQYRSKKEPEPVYSLEDLKSFPNDVLFTYFMEKEQPSMEELLDLFDNPSLLEKKLKEHSPKLISETNLPELQDMMDYKLPAFIIAGTLKARTEKYVACPFENLLMVADEQEETCEFPSGLKVKYHLLTNETSANTSIMLFGYGEPTTNEIYIRKNYVIFELARAKHYENHPAFREFSPHISEFGKYIIPIIVSHEMNDISIYNSGKAPKDIEENELMTEKNQLEFLKEQKVPFIQYKLFHTLRAGCNQKTGEKNFSKKILEAL